MKVFSIDEIREQYVAWQSRGVQTDSNRLAAMVGELLSEMDAKDAECATAHQSMASAVEQELQAKLEHLQAAVRELYLAARWTADRPVDETRLWETVRDAAEIPAGSSTAAGLNPDAG